MNRLTHYAAFIFDMDGTLVDNMRVHNQVWINFLAEKGAQVDPKTFNDLTAGKTNPEIFRMFLGAQFPDALIPEYSQEKETRYRQMYHQQIHPVAGLEAFLSAAQEAGVRLGLATSAGPENIDFVMDSLGIAPYFQAVVNGEEIKRGKPDPEIFLEAAKRLNVAPETCLVFEDSYGGIEAGRRAGMAVIAITTGLSKEQALALPGVVLAVQDFAQAQQIFQQEGILQPGSAA